MRIVPEDIAEGRVWSATFGSMIGVGAWLEKRAGLGEDAEPTMRVHRSGRGLIGVYDGTGGAGAGIARRLRDGTELSGAFVVSRLAREVCETWFKDLVDGGSTFVSAGDLHERLAAALSDELGYLEQPSNGLKGSLHRLLPTTMALALYDESGADVDVDVLWAGDSRCLRTVGRAGPPGSLR